MKAHQLLTAFSCCIISGVSSVSASSDDVTASANAYETHNEIYFSDDGVIDSFKGSIGAVSGEIVERVAGPENRPLLKLKLTDTRRSLWVASTVEVTEKQLSVDQKVNVLGFFDETKNETQYVSKVADENYYILGVCFSIEPLKQPVYNSSLLKQCQDWEAGTLDLTLPLTDIQQ